jgi:regulatory protein SWI5
MLSNPSNNLHNRQRQHRRQNSTPTAFEPVKASNLPNIQRHGGHRRGISLDQRRRQTPPQEFMVSTTNTGYQTTQQHILRETQQQRLARPGQQFNQFDNDENYLNSPIVTPHRQSFDAGCTNQYGNGNQSQFSYSGPINTIINVDPNQFSESNDFNLFSSETILTPSAFLDFSAGFDNCSDATKSENQSRRSSRRISGGIADRVSQFENLALQSPQRPITPPNQNVQGQFRDRKFHSQLNFPGYFPLTPVDTPHDRMIKHELMNQRFLDSYDTSMEETIKPRSNQRARGVFDDLRKEAEMNSMPSPPRTGPMTTPNTFDSAPMPSGNFMNMSNINLDFMKNDDQFNGSPHSQASSNLSPTISYHSSPEITQMAMFGDPFMNKPNLDAPQVSYPEPTAHGLSIPSSPIQDSPYRRSESVSSINPDESITETGITIDDIASFISGPDPLDGKWVCLYPDCKKRFGRKENIKSHVQTHLGDRQFQCPHCKKCFVRQHDLKRHAKIHSGVKPYPCQCGNSFARHDALTRHRQRGMCIGAFEGVIKKTVKRGRPRKNRPDDEQRLKKSSRTRSKNKAMSSASSTTDCSESNGGQSPRSDADVLDNKPFADYDYPQASSIMHTGSFEFSQQHSPRNNNCVSPQAIQTAHSPSAFSHHSQSHRGSISEHLPSHPASPAKSIHSYHSPPGLCESSSSPAPSNHYYDLDHGSQHGDEMHLNMNGLTNISEHDDEMFLEAFAATSNEGMSTLERDPELLMGKFDDAFSNTAGDDLFRNNEDVFFGSP